jgi:tryptophan 2,3-dioxygenase
MAANTTALERTDLNEYEDYAELRALLALQHPRTDAPAELSFIVVTQVMELYFTLLRHEWESARDSLADPDPDVRSVVRTLRRGHGVQDALIAGWEALRTLTPAEFDAFRDSFGVASGIQSYQYRHIEFLLGARHPRALAVHEQTPRIHDELAAQAAAPSLYDATLPLLRRRGFAVPDALVTRDHRTEYGGDDRVVAVWRAVYADSHGAHSNSAHSNSAHSNSAHSNSAHSTGPGTRHADLADLGDALFDTAERHLRWKQRHLLSVWRSMGDKPGSAGTSGAQWLERGVHRKYFPDLWTLRDQGWA